MLKAINLENYIEEKTHPINLIVNGQCVYLFESESKEECSFYFLNDENDGYEVIFKHDSIKVIRLSTGQVYIDGNNNSGLISAKGAYYWFSLDEQNQMFQAGIGEARLENRKYSFMFTFGTTLGHISKYEDELRKMNKKFLSSISMIKPNNTKPLRLLRDPINLYLPLKVKDMNDITMDCLALNEIMPASSLSLVSQKLYYCICGKKFTLETEEFPDFPQAIEHSIKTPGLWCYEKLKEKSTEFSKKNPNPLETYLRITLGSNNGDSPGIPYVMEIWPPNHYSPIHSHAGAEAIIRVLHGQINVSLYPFLSEDNGIEPFGDVDFYKNDVTWISPTLNQIHQLKNINQNTTCITIQCYMYQNENTAHYDYFDYINSSGKIKQYEPDSDMDFTTFKRLMKKEWMDYLEENVKKCC